MSETSFKGRYVSRVFGVPEDLIKGVVINAMDEIGYRKSKNRVKIRRIDEVWPIGRAMSRIASRTRTSLTRAGIEPWEALHSILGSDDVNSSTLRKLRSLINGKGLIGFPALTPDATLVAWGVKRRELPEILEGIVQSPPVRTLIALAVLDDVAETLLNELGDRAERLSKAFQRAFDDRAVKLLGTCLCAWLSEKLDGFEEWWEEGGGWRVLYRLVREDKLVERVVKERTGIEPGR